MAAESLIKINVDDSKFKAFTAVFDKYKESLKSLPAGWQSTNKAIKKFGESADNALKKANKTQKDFQKNVKGSLQDLRGVARVSGTIAKNFASAALSVTKWVTLSALGGGFGLGAIASNASNMRKEAQGTGVATGDLRAARTNFGKYISPESTLSRIADLQNDLANRQILMRLGGKEGENAAEMLPAILKNSISQFKTGGQTSQYAEAMGLTQVLSIEDLRRLSQITEKELNDTITQFVRDRQLMKVTDADSRAMQDFWIQIRRAGEQLQVGFIKVIAPIAPLLTTFSEKISEFIQNIFNNKEFKQGIHDFVNWFGSDEFKNAGKIFLEELKNFGSALKSIAEFVNWFSFKKSEPKPDTPKGKVGYTYKNGVIDKDNPNNYWGGKWLNFMSPAYQNAVELQDSQKFLSGIEQKKNLPAGLQNAQKFLGGIEQKRNLPAGLLDQIWKNESARGKNMISSAGALGHFQFMPATAKQYGLKDPFDFETSADAAGKMMNYLLKKFDNNIEHALAAYNWGEGNVSKHIKAGRGFAQLPKETRDYIRKFDIQVSNSAGSDLVVTSNGLR